MKHVILTEMRVSALSLERLIADHAPLEAQAATRAGRSGVDDLYDWNDRPPKGALHGHRVLPGHMPHPVCPSDLGQAGDKIGTPADWAWAGGFSIVSHLPRSCWAFPSCRRRDRSSIPTWLPDHGGDGRTQRFHSADGAQTAAAVFDNPLFRAMI